MKEFGKNHMVASIKQAIYEPKQSKYVKKVIGSVNRHIRGKRYSNYFQDEISLVEYSKPTTSTSSDSSDTYDEILNQDCDQLLENLTVDSGIITYKDETQDEKSPSKKLTFSPDNDKVIEIDVENFQPKYYDMPQKCIVHMTETPRPQKVEYKPSNCSTPKNKNGEITAEVLEGANLMRNYHWKPEYALNLSESEETCERQPTCRSLDEKFVVNLFESRKSKRWNKKNIRSFNFDNTQSLIDKESLVSHDIKTNPESHKTNYSEPRPDSFNENEMFQKYKKERDVECVRMVQASSVLKLIRKNPHREWSDELLAEKILLETDEKYTLLLNKIRDIGYSEIISPKVDHAASITLSNFEFSMLAPQEGHKSKYTDFFVVTLSHETELLMSTVMSPSDKQIIFNEQFTFRNLNSDFHIKMKIFSIILKTSESTTLCSFLRKKTKQLCPMSKIYYEDVNTNEMEASSVLKPSFKCCGELLLTKDNIGSSHFTLVKIPDGSMLLSNVKFSLQVDNLDINSKMSGFLTLGIPRNGNEILFWERKWCVLNGTIFSIYNYPSEEDFGKPVLSINLEYCLVPLSTNVQNCPRKKTFLLKTGRPGGIDENNNSVNLKKKSNFILKKYFFACDNNNDYNLWTSQLQSILQCLIEWRKLVFFDDYY